MALEPLPQDAVEISAMLGKKLPGCAFCGATSLVIGSSVNETPDFSKTSVYQTRVSCECGASLFYNARTRGEAQRECFSRWSQRATAKENCL